MNRKLSKREVFLLIGLAVAAVVLYRGWRADEIGRASTRRAENEVRRPLGDPPVVRMDLLATVVEGFDPPGRDLFTYYRPPRKPPRAKPEPEPRKVERKPRPKPPPPPPKAKPQPKAPAPKFRYMGFLGPKDSRIAVFEAKDELMLARVGDTVDEEFKLLEFKYELVVMGYTDEKWADRTTELKMSPR